MFAVRSLTGSRVPGTRPTKATQVSAVLRVQVQLYKTQWRERGKDSDEGVRCYLLNKYNCARAQWRESKASISSPSNVDKSSVPFWPAHSSHLSQVTSVACEGKPKARSRPYFSDNEQSRKILFCQSKWWRDICFRQLFSHKQTNEQTNEQRK